MREIVLAERLLSLVTSQDRAAAISGDLAEERQNRGPIWLWLELAGTALALWRNVLTSAPLAALALALAGGALFAALALVGVAAIMLFPLLISTKVSWIPLAFFWWGGALWTGASLVGLAPKHGMSVCALLAGIYEALLIAAAFIWIDAWRDLLEGQFIPFLTIGLVVAAPMLAGGVIARLRLIAWGFPALKT